MPIIWQTVGKLIVEIFGLQPDGTLASGGVIRSLVFNILFIPCGSLTALWLLQLVQIRSEKRDKRDKQGRERRCGRIVAVAICTVVSILIELLQSLTRLGIADVKDVIGNCIGSVIGVVMVMLYEWKKAARG
jgi:glycopeptide antibiotics resistance protein